MANRVAKFFEKKQTPGKGIPDGIDKEFCSELRSDPTEPIVGVPKICGFCLSPLNNPIYLSISQSKPNTVICANCIQNMNVLCVLAANYASAYEDRQAIGTIMDRVYRLMASMTISSRMRDEAHGLIRRLLCRSIAILCKTPGKVCPDSGVSLKPHRIAFVGADAQEIGMIMQETAAITGLPVHETSVVSIVEGLDALHVKCNRDPLFSPHGTLIVMDGATEVAPNCNVIFCCLTMADVPEGVTVVNLDEELS